MSSSQNSLSDLASLCLKVQTGLSEMATKDSSFLEGLKGDINLLQTMCPNHSGVVEARVCWLEEILRRFEVEVIEQYDRDGDPPDPKGSLWVWLSSEINAYLKRSYLKQDFATVYERVINLYKRGKERTADRGGVWQFGHFSFTHEIARFERELLEGKL
ncbi:MAG: hypothetical protein AAB821_01575 [Patescibacteria group bacterium]